MYVVTLTVVIVLVNGSTITNQVAKTGKHASHCHSEQRKNPSTNEKPSHGNVAETLVFFQDWSA